MRNVSDGNRYLSLTGVIVDSDYHRSTITPELTDFKRRYWPFDDDDPLVLHRCDIHSCSGPFAFLRNLEQRQTFDADLLGLLSRWRYTVITAAIDKQAHWTKYSTWAQEPYAYCMEVLTEKYVLWLQKQGKTGDVLAEARGQREDTALSRAYSMWYVTGTRYASVALRQQCLSSNSLKLKRKEANISGLQIADLLAAPSFRYGLWKRTGQEIPQGFIGQAVGLLRTSKYNRKWDGTIDGYGMKWLP